MSETKKIESIAAFRLDPGISLGTYAAWGSTVTALGTGHAFPYTVLSPEDAIKVAPDNSIDGNALKDLPVIMEKTSGIGSLERYVKYNGMGRFLYWMFGYEDGGSSPQTLGGGYYSHLYELDAHERHVTPYRTAEQTAGDYASYNRKVRSGVLAVKYGTNDYRFRNLMCSGFGFNSKSGDFFTMTAKGKSWKTERADYSSSSWTFPTGIPGASLNIPHHHFTVKLGVYGALVTLGVTDFSIDVTIPLSSQFDTESGLYLKEPVLEGQYEISASMTLTRHAADTWLAYRDDWTSDLAFQAVAASGSYEFGLYMPSVRVLDSQVSGDAVAKNTIKLTWQREQTIASPIFATEFGSHDVIQGSPLYCLVKDTNSTNEMRRE